MYIWQVVLFVFSVLSGFAFIANQIPQEVSMPPVVERFDPALVQTKQDIVEIGQKIFFGKGQCALCHSIGGGTMGRCPNLEGVGAKLTREFEYEAYTDPEAFVYLDFTSSPPKRFAARMPPINKPPIGLTGPEMLTVFSFLQNQAGNVEIEPAEVIALAQADEGGARGGAAVEIAGDADNGKLVYAKMECAGCHKIGEETGGGQGPNLISIKKEGVYLRHTIFGANKEGSPHSGFDEKVTVKEMNDLIFYLLTINAAPPTVALPHMAPPADSPATTAQTKET